MKKPKSTGAVVLLVLLLGAAAWLWARHRREQKIRDEAAYQAIVRQYEKDLREGMSRAEVENYLEGRHVKATLICCVAEYRGTYDEIVKVGVEGAPWYCTQIGVYVGLQFNGSATAAPALATPMDTLRKVSLFRRGEDCL